MKLHKYEALFIKALFYLAQHSETMPLEPYDVANPLTVMPALVREALVEISTAHGYAYPRVQVNNRVFRETGFYGYVCTLGDIYNKPPDGNIYLIPSLVVGTIDGVEKQESCVVSRRGKDVNCFYLILDKPLGFDKILKIELLCPITTYIRAYVGACEFQANLGKLNPRLLSAEPSAKASGKLNAQQQGVVSALKRSRTMKARRIGRRDEYSDCVDVMLLHGPPGTGKTLTLVEAIVDAVKEKKQVIACAPTHQAVKNLARGLLNYKCYKFKILGTSEQYPDFDRHTYSCSWKNISVFIGTFAKMTYGEVIFRLTRSKMSADLIVIDEAGQAGPIFYAALFHARPGCQILFAGDHRQLPYHAHYDEVSESYLEAMARRHPKWVTELTTQYRMHPEICELVSGGFYGNKLLSDPGTRATPLVCSELEEDSPLDAVCFMDVSGKCEENRGSYQNPQEADMVLNLLEVIGSSSENAFVLTPYSAQVDCVLKKLDGRFPKVTVSTIDGAQGQEAGFVILTMVRTDGMLGFSGDHQRICVAMSRAISLLCVICSQNSYRGVPVFDQLFRLGQPLAFEEGRESDEEKSDEGEVCP